MLKKQDIQAIEELHAEVFFPGTEENGYGDAGLFKFLPYVYTKDEHDKLNPEKPLIGEGDEYLLIVFLYMLACEDLLVPKSRQIRMSWACATDALWTAMSGKHRRVAYQSKKEEDSYAQTTKGSKDAGGGRIDFIHRRLPRNLRDPNIMSGRGNLAGQLNFSPNDVSDDGVIFPWAYSKIVGMPQGAEQVRQYTLSLYINDEAAYQDQFREAIIAAAAAVTGGGQSISVSSVSAGSFFNQVVLNVPNWKRQHILSHGDMTIHEINPIVKRGMKYLGLEWPKGMRSWQTNAGSWVLETHYSADPKKDPERLGAEWHKNAVMKPGYDGDYNSPGWQTEMEINYEAGAGAPVFPFLNARSPIFIDSFVPSDIIHGNKGKGIRPHRFFAGYDYGTQNPSAFVVISVDEEGKLYWVWELYEPCENMAEHVARIKSCPYWNQIEKVVCDPSIMSKTQQGANGLMTLAEQFELHGLHLERGRRAQDVPIAHMLKSTYWVNPEEPTAFITKSCPNTAKEMMELVYEQFSSSAVELRRNAPEKIRQKNNHAFDATALILDDGIDAPIYREKVNLHGTYQQVVNDLKLQVYREQKSKSGIYVP